MPMSFEQQMAAALSASMQDGQQAGSTAAAGQRSASQLVAEAQQKTVCALSTYYAVLDYGYFG